MIIRSLDSYNLGYAELTLDKHTFSQKFANYSFNDSNLSMMTIGALNRENLYFKSHS